MSDEPAQEWECPLLGEVIVEGACMDISAHALELFNLTNDEYVIGILGDRRFDRGALAQVCGKCEHLQWGS